MLRAGLQGAQHSKGQEAAQGRAQGLGEAEFMELFAPSCLAGTPRAHCLPAAALALRDGVRVRDLHGATAVPSNIVSWSVAEGGDPKQWPPGWFIKCPSLPMGTVMWVLGSLHSLYPWLGRWLGPPQHQMSPQPNTQKWGDNSPLLYGLCCLA